MRCTLVVQSYGSLHEYRRGVFAVWSFFSWNSYDLAQVQAFVFTDAPDFFKRFLDPMPVVYFSLSAKRIAEMRGSINFVHRVKIEVIQEAFKHTDSTLFYIDSDTAFVSDFKVILEKMSARQVFMHKHEYAFQEMMKFPLPAGKPFHEFYGFVASKPFSLTDGAQLTVSPSQISWNAGVIVLEKEHQKCLPDVFKLTDEFHIATKHHGCEQYAFDITLSRMANISSSEEVVFHYWPVVQKKIADIFLFHRITDSWALMPVDQRRESIKKWTTSLPGFIDGHMLKMRDNAIQAFHESQFRIGWWYAMRTLLQDPSALHWRDLLYHLKRNLLHFIKKK